MTLAVFEWNGESVMPVVWCERYKKSQNHVERSLYNIAVHSSCKWTWNVATDQSESSISESCVVKSAILFVSPVSRHRHGSGGRVLAVIPPSPVMRRSSDPHLSPSSSNNNLPCSDAPPSTHSTPAHGYPSESSEQGGSYCELRPAQAPIPPCKSYVERLRVEEGQSPGSGAPDGVEGFILPLVETSSSFKPGKYQSTLLPGENKPLEMSVLKRVKELLAEVDPKTAAKHITMADCMVNLHTTHQFTFWFLTHITNHFLSNKWFLHELLEDPRQDYH